MSKRDHSRECSRLLRDALISNDLNTLLSILNKTEAQELTWGQIRTGVCHAALKGYISLIDALYLHPIHLCFDHNEVIGYLARANNVDKLKELLTKFPCRATELWSHAISQAVSNNDTLLFLINLGNKQEHPIENAFASLVANKKCTLSKLLLDDIKQYESSMSVFSNFHASLTLRRLNMSPVSFIQKYPSFPKNHMLLPFAG